MLIVHSLTRASMQKNSTQVLNGLKHLEPDESGMYVISAHQRKRWMTLLRQIDARDESRQVAYKGRKRAAAKAR